MYFLAQIQNIEWEQSQCQQPTKELDNPSHNPSYSYYIIYIQWTTYGLKKSLLDGAMTLTTYHLLWLWLRGGGGGTFTRIFADAESADDYFLHFMQICSVKSNVLIGVEICWGRSSTWTRTRSRSSKQFEIPTWQKWNSLSQSIQEQNYTHVGK